MFNSQTDLQEPLQWFCASSSPSLAVSPLSDSPMRTRQAGTIHADFSQRLFLTQCRQTGCRFVSWGPEHGSPQSCLPNFFESPQQRKARLSRASRVPLPESSCWHLHKVSCSWDSAGDSEACKLNAPYPTLPSALQEQTPVRWQSSVTLQLWHSS